VVFGPDLGADAHALAGDLRGEFCVAVAGTVISRGENVSKTTCRPARSRSRARRLEVFSAADPLPLQVADDDKIDALETTRLKYRYLDLRRPSLQKNFVLRSRMATLTRITLAELGFLELETPYMVKYTPGGARNFLVPSRLNPGQFYALAESPQIFKQLFMVAGMDKYFQICRCFRDEDLRNDRQPEFTQIDVEISYATPDRVHAPIEALITRAWKDILGVALPAVPAHDVGRGDGQVRVGQAGPALRARVLRHQGPRRRLGVPRVQRGGRGQGHLRAGGARGDADPRAHRQADRAGQEARVGRREGPRVGRVGADGAWNSPLTKNLSAEIQAAITERAGARPGSVLLIVADSFHTTHQALNALRLELRDSLNLVEKSGRGPWQFLWVTDFPLFERSDKGWVSSHHPFTSPRTQDVPLLDTDPGQVLAQAYDLVLNGNEIGGGSIRIHRSDVQAKIFAVLGLDEAQVQQKFGFLLEAFRYGPPPHGGIALGLDRISMLMAGASSLRDVIAFPKTQKGTDLMTNCPNSADEAQMAELFIRHRRCPARVRGRRSEGGCHHFADDVGERAASCGSACWPASRARRAWCSARRTCRGGGWGWSAGSRGCTRSRGSRPKKAFWVGWLTGIITVFWGFIWLTELLDKFAGFGTVPRLFIHLLFAAFQGLQWALPARRSTGCAGGPAATCCCWRRCAGSRARRCCRTCSRRTWR
jgi:aspartyl-tRNA synthetase